MILGLKNCLGFLLLYNVMLMFFVASAAAHGNGASGQRISSSSVSASQTLLLVHTVGVLTAISYLIPGAESFDWFSMTKVLREENFNGTMPPPGPAFNRLMDRVTAVLKEDPEFYEYLQVRMRNLTRTMPQNSTLHNAPGVNIVEEYERYARHTSTTLSPRQVWSQKVARAAEMKTSSGVIQMGGPLQNGTDTAGTSSTYYDKLRVSMPTAPAAFSAGASYSKKGNGPQAKARTAKREPGRTTVARRRGRPNRKAASVKPKARKQSSDSDSSSPIFKDSKTFEISSATSSSSSSSSSSPSSSSSSSASSSIDASELSSLSSVSSTSTELTSSYRPPSSSYSSVSSSVSSSLYPSSATSLSTSSSLSSPPESSPFSSSPSSSD